MEGSVDTIEALQLEIEQLRHQNAAINEQLLDSRQECDTLQVANRRLEQQAESLGEPPVFIWCHVLRASCCATGLKEDIIRTFEIQLRARDDQISGMDVELNACYQRLGQNESAYRERSKQEKHTTSKLLPHRPHPPPSFMCCLQGLKTSSSCRFKNKCAAATNTLLR